MIEERSRGESEGDYVPFHETGATAKGSFRCADCGYGVVVTGILPPCPMCGCAAVWEDAPWSPFRGSPLL